MESGKEEDRKGHGLTRSTNWTNSAHRVVADRYEWRRRFCNNAATFVLRIVEDKPKQKKIQKSEQRYIMDSLLKAVLYR